MVNNCSKLKEEYLNCVKRIANVKGEILNTKLDSIDTNKLSDYKFKEEINKKCDSKLFAECLSQKFEIVSSREKDLRIIKYLSESFDKNNDSIYSNKMN